MKIIIRRGGGGEGEGGRTSRLGWQNFIINSLISYGVGDASLQYNGDTISLLYQYTNTSVCTEEVVRFLKRYHKTLI